MDKKITCKSISYKQIVDMYKQKNGGRQPEHKKLKIELCHELGLLDVDTEKNCSLRHRNNRYQREELEWMALRTGRYRMSQIRDMSYQDLCQILELPTNIREKKKKTDDGNGGNCITRSHTVLKSYQERVVRYLEKNRQLLIYHTMGSGKTLTAIAIAECYLDRYPDHRVIVVLPAILKANFESELNNKYRNTRHQDKYEIYSIQTFVNRMKKGEENERDLRHSMMIIDEVHNLRTLPEMNRQKKVGIQTFYIANAMRYVDKTVLLTGTPLINSKKDMYSIYYLFNPDETVKDIKNLSIEEILTRLSCKISYYKPSMNISDFPERKDHYIMIEMSKKFQKQYDDTVQNILTKGFDSANIDLFGEKDLAVFYNGVRRAVNILENDVSHTNKKIDWVLQLLKERPGQKTIIFSHFKEAGIFLIARKLRQENYGIITGDVSLSNRKKIIDEYNQDKIHVLFITKAAGEGINLIGTRNVILMEPGWNDASIEQVIARAIRYKSHEHLPIKDRKVNVYHLFHLKSTDIVLFKRFSSMKISSSTQNEPSSASFTEWIIKNTENDTPPLTISTNSIDLILYLLKTYKNHTLSPLLRQLQHISIESLSC